MIRDKKITESSLKNGVAKKFKLLIVAGRSRGGSGGWVGQGAGQQVGILEGVAEGGKFHGERLLWERGWKRSMVAASRSSSTWV